MSVTIRPEEREDLAEAHEVERLALGSDEEPAVVEAVRDEEGSLALVAEDEGEVIGHVQFSRAWIGAQPVSALGPIGVRPDRQGQGIGSALVRAGLEEAARRGEAVMIVLGDPSSIGGSASSRASIVGSATRSPGSERAIS